MFLKQVVQNATTWSWTLQELLNLIIEFEQIKENMSKTHNRLQTFSQKLKTMQKTLKNHDK
jgi:predicted  nucleic acid-binding Zn-ribbon protein